MRLEPSTNFRPTIDRRPRVPEPLPVRLVAVGDVTIHMPAGLELDLDRFYVNLLDFDRDSADGPGGAPAYRAENARLRVQIIEPPLAREDYHPVGIIVRSLAALEAKIVEAEIEYVRQKSLYPGREALALTDPAGNWVEITESREIR